MFSPRDGQTSLGRYRWTGRPAELRVKGHRRTGIRGVTTGQEGRFPAVAGRLSGGYPSGYSEYFTQILMKKPLQNCEYN